MNNMTDMTLKKEESIQNQKEALLTALHASNGIVSIACNSVELSRETFYRYCREDVYFLNQVSEIKEICLDFVENKLFDQIKLGNITAILFYLKCKGKTRGYIEKQETDNLPEKIIVRVMGEEIE